MDRAFLEKMSKEELIEFSLVIWNLLEKTQAELNEAKRPRKNSGNSSRPPSTDKKAGGTLKSGKVGGKVGHKGYHFQPLTEVDSQVTIPLSDCPHCQLDLGDQEVLQTRIHQVIGIEIRRVVTNYLQEGKYCGWCGQVVFSGLPDGVEKTHYDSSIRSLAAYMNNYHHLSHPRLIELFSDLADIKLSKGTVNSILSISPALLEEFNIYLRGLLQKSDLLGIDETSFRVAVMNFWLWVFQNRCFSYFYFDPHRSSEVLKEVIGEYFDGTLLSDFYSAYNRLQARRKQKCNAHLLRELAYIVECEVPSKPYITEIFKLLLEAKEFKEKYAPYKPEQLQDEIGEFKDRLKALCERSLPTQYQEAIRIQKRLINHQNEILTFLEIAEVPFDNNTSEQAIRAAVVHRKVIQCFRTIHGANNYARWLSLIQTLRKQKIQVFPAITRLFKGSVPLIQWN